jgi:ankyrin repeat protein
MMSALLFLVLLHGLLPAGESVDGLFTAIRQGDRALVARLSGQGADVNAANPGGVTPLHAAACDAELTHGPLDAGADPNAATSSGQTPLLGAVRNGNEAVVRMLRRAGANVNALRAAASRSVPPLRVALTTGNLAIIRHLIESGAGVKLAGPPSGSGLKRGCIECVRALFQIGSSPTVQSAAAAAPGSLKMVELLVEAGAPVNGQEARGYTPWMHAALSYNQKAALIAHLLRKGADIAEGNETGDTVVSIAPRFGDTQVAAALRLAGAPDTTAITLPPPVENNTVKAAISRAVPLLQKIGPPVFKQRGCVTCHNNTLPVQVAVMARRRGLPIDEETQSREVRQIAADHRARRQSLFIGAGIPEIYGYTLLALDAAGSAPDPYLAVIRAETCRGVSCAVQGELPEPTARHRRPSRCQELGRAPKNPFESVTIPDSCTHLELH